MKRSESVLVYAVTAVLAVILVVAVVFGNEGEAATLPSDGGETVAGQSIEEVLGGPGPAVGTGQRDLGAVGAPRAGGGSEVGEEESDAGDAGAGPSVPMGPLRASGNVVTLATALGPFRAENQADGTRYRVVPVRPGDTFSGLVLEWTADPSKASVVLALNEWVDPSTRRLLAGEDELWLPWVDDSELLAAWQKRREVAAPAAAPVPVDRTAPRSPVAGETHVVQKGESLWAIAERKVGRRAAPGYIDAIVAANPSIVSRDAVRAGQRIVLPAIE